MSDLYTLVKISDSTYEIRHSLWTSPTESQLRVVLTNPTTPEAKIDLAFPHDPNWTAYRWLMSIPLFGYGPKRIGDLIISKGNSTPMGEYLVALPYLQMICQAIDEAREKLIAENMDRISTWKTPKKITQKPGVGHVDPTNQGKDALEKFDKFYRSHPEKPEPIEVRGSRPDDGGCNRGHGHEGMIYDVRIPSGSMIQVIRLCSGCLKELRQVVDETLDNEFEQDEEN